MAAANRPSRVTIREIADLAGVSIATVSRVVNGHNDVSEETRDPTRNAPWGIFLSVAVSAVAGWALLLAVTLAIGDLHAAAAADNPFIHVLRTALGTRAGGALATASERESGDRQHEDAAREELGGISRPTLFRIRQRGEIAVVRVGRRVFFRPADVTAYIDRNRDPAGLP